MPTISPNAAAGEHYAEAERILHELPLIKNAPTATRRTQVALIHAALALAASLGATQGGTS
jgi:hypothetical protein